jgi:hypothetical protein
MPVEPPAKRLTDAAIARALGVAPPTFCQWRAQGCPNTSAEDARNWRATRPKKIRSKKSQQRFGNKNAANKLEKQVERMGLSPPGKIAPKLTRELLEKVAQCFSDGFTNEETGLLCGISEQTICAWRRLQPVRKAELLRKRFYIHEILNGTRKDWCRIAWWLERRWPLEFSRPEVAHAIRVSNQTTNVVQNLVISSELAKELTHRSASVQTQVKKLFAQYSTQPANQKQALPNRDGQGEDVPG